MAERKRRKRAANGQGGVYQRADGRWEAKIFVDLPDGRRKRISVYGDTQQETLNELTRMLDQQRRGIPVVTTTMTVADYMNYWLKHIAEPSIRRTTYASYEGDVRLHIIPGIGSRKLKSLQPAHVRAWLTGLQTLCQCCAQRKDAARVANSKLAAALCNPLGAAKTSLASSSIQHILRVLRAALQDAVDEELLNRNVARLVQLRVTEKKKVRAFTREETLRFLKTAQGHRLYALWAVPFRWVCVVAKHSGWDGRTSTLTPDSSRSIARCTALTASCNSKTSRPKVRRASSHYLRRSCPSSRVTAWAN